MAQLYMCIHWGIHRERRPADIRQQTLEAVAGTRVCRLGAIYYTYICTYLQHVHPLTLEARKPRLYQTLEISTSTSKLDEFLHITMVFRSPGYGHFRTYINLM